MNRTSQNIDKAKIILVIIYIIFIIYCILLAKNAIAGFPNVLTSKHHYPFLSDKPIGEDAFYMLTVSKNIALGKGIVYNYNIRTTGIQPLVTFIYAGIYYLCCLFRLSDWSFLRLIIVFNCSLLILFSIIISKIVLLLFNTSVAKGACYSIVSTITLLNFGLFRLFSYSLETGTYLVLLSTIILLTLKNKFVNFTGYKSFYFSLLIAFTAFARIDFIIVITIITCMLFGRRKLSLKSFMVIILIPFLFISMWFFYIYVSTSSFFPSSGIAQSTISRLPFSFTRVSKMLLAIVDHFSPLFTTAGKMNLLIIDIVSIFILLVFWNRDLNLTIKSIVFYKKQECIILLYWLTSFLCLTLVYTIFFWASHFYFRYVAPLSIIALIFWSIYIISISVRFPKLPFILTILVTIIFFSQCIISFHTGRVGNTHAVSAGWLRIHGKGYKIGAFQSGTIGFFNTNVINLDGKINHNALIAIRKRNLEYYVDSLGIDMLIDWPSYINHFFDRAYLNSKWSIYPKSVGNSISVCLIRKK